MLFPPKKLNSTHFAKVDFIEDLSKYLTQSNINIFNHKASSRTTKPRWFGGKDTVYTYTIDTSTDAIDFFVDAKGNLVRVEVVDVIVATVRKRGDKEHELKHTYKELGRKIIKALEAQRADKGLGKELTASSMRKVLGEVKDDDEAMILLSKQLESGSGYYLVLDSVGYFWNKNAQEFTTIKHLITPYKKLADAKLATDKAHRIVQL